MSGRYPGCPHAWPSAKSNGGGGEGGGAGGDGGANGGEGSEGGEGGEGGGEGDRKVKQTLKPPLTFEPSETQLSAEASTPSGPSLPE